MQEVQQKITAHILLAEDSLVNQEVAGATLEFLGCTVDVADNGRKAVQRWQSRQYDQILMDCIMPEMDGYEAAKTIRFLEDGVNHIPIIAISAGKIDIILPKIKRAGMDDWLMKPFTTSELYNLLCRWLSAAKE